MQRYYAVFLFIGAFYNISFTHLVVRMNTKTFTKSIQSIEMMIYCLRTKLKNNKKHM